MLVGVEPRAEGVVERDGWRVRWQAFGDGERTVLLLPTWSIVHTDFWRHQVPALGDRYRVVTFDGLGNGASDRPTDPAAYGDLPVAVDAVAVMDAAGVSSASVMGVSQGGPWALALAAQHPERVDAAVFIAPNVPLAPGHPERVAAAQRFDERLDDHDGWSRWNRHSWLSDYAGFLRFFFSQCFTEPASEPHIDHFVGMGLQTSPEVLLATMGTPEQNVTPDLAAELAGRLRCPALVIHGDADAITPVARGTELARLAGSQLVVLAGSGHEPQCRSPEIVNPLLLTFLADHTGGAR
jgi:pimeloyl-ACP methyl ester carboxylesterase